MKNNKTVVILLSDKRSGSTMFQRELCKHREIQTVAYSPHTYLETHHWLKAAVMLDIDPSLFIGGKIYSGYGTQSNARTYMEDCIRKNIPEFDCNCDDHDLIFKGWEALCDRFTQPVFFEKSPQFLSHWGCLELMLQWINQTDYQVKVIGLVRNPLSVLYSAQNLFHTDPQKRQYYWLETYKNLLRFQQQISPDNFLMCRYEEMIHQPLQAFADVCHFIGVSDYHEIGAGTHTSSVKKWATDTYFTLQLADEVKTMAQRFGYTNDELRNPVKSHPPLIYRINRNIEASLKLLFARLKDRFIYPIILRNKNY